VVKKALKQLDDLLSALDERSGALAKAIVKAGEADGERKKAGVLAEEAVPAMNSLREVGDQIEQVVADDLWPLPRYAEMLFLS
jgi:glutamine synthetase